MLLLKKQMGNTKQNINYEWSTVSAFDVGLESGETQVQVHSQPRDLMEYLWVSHNLYCEFFSDG